MTAVSRRTFLLVAGSALSASGCAEDSAESAGVRVVPTPDAGIVPAAHIDAAGLLRIAYLKGQDLLYAESDDAGRTFGAALRINDREGQAQGGLFRGPEMAVGDDASVHVVWYSRAWETSGEKSEQGVMYTRRIAGGRFEPSRNLGKEPSDGFSVGARGREVALAWHNGDALKILRSHDAGASFDAASALDGALPCECCDTNLHVAEDGRLFLFYRDRKDDRRDMYLAMLDRGGRLEGRVKLDDQSWIIKACPLSSSGLVVTQDSALVTWERDGKVLLSRLKRAGLQREEPVSAGSGKHPIVLAGAGTMLLAWSDGQRLVWQIRDAASMKVRKSGSLRRQVSYRAAGVVAPDGTYLLIA